MGYRANDCDTYLQSPPHWLHSFSVRRSQAFASVLCTLDIWDPLCIIGLRGHLYQYGVDHVTYYVIQQIQMFFFEGEAIQLTKVRKYIL